MEFSTVQLIIWMGASPVCGAWHSSAPACLRLLITHNLHQQIFLSQHSHSHSPLLVTNIARVAWEDDSFVFTHITNKWLLPKVYFLMTVKCITAHGCILTAITTIRPLSCVYPPVSDETVTLLSFVTTLDHTYTAFPLYVFFCARQILC